MFIFRVVYTTGVLRDQGGIAPSWKITIACVTPLYCTESAWADATGPALRRLEGASRFPGKFQLAPHVGAGGEQL